MAAAATVATIASCEKEQNFTTPEEIVSTTVSISVPDTKATLGPSDGTSRPVYWNEGDRIVINGSVSNALAGEYEGATSADFTFGTTLSATASHVADNQVSGTITVYGTKATNGDRYFGTLYGYGKDAASGIIAGTVSRTMTVYGSAVTATDNLVIE